MLTTSTATATDRFPGSADPARVFGTEELRNLRIIARGLAGGPVEAEDLLQDALERALRNFDRFEVGSNLYAWLRTIMYRSAIDQTRAQRRQRTRLQQVRRMAEPAAWSDADDEAGGLTEELGIEDLRVAVAGLTEPLRRVYQLFALDGLSYEEVAARLGIPSTTVGTRLLRARLKLREILAAQAAAKRAPIPITSARRARAEAPATTPRVAPSRRTRPATRISA